MACLINEKLRDRNNVMEVAAIARLEANPLFPALRRSLEGNCGYIGVPITLLSACDPVIPPAAGIAGVGEAVNQTRSDVYSDAFEHILYAQEQKLQADFHRTNHVKVPALMHYYNSTIASFNAEKSELIRRLAVLYKQENVPTMNAYSAYPNNSSHQSDLYQYRSQIRSMTVYYRQRRSLLIAEVSNRLEKIRSSMKINEHSSANALPSKPVELKLARTLSPFAVKTMSNWYDLHFQSPYPTDEEKEELARTCNITLSQVKSWFANKRNRTFNTKPLRQKMALQMFNNNSKNKNIYNNNNNSNDSHENNNNNSSNQSKELSESSNEPNQLLSMKNGKAPLQGQLISGTSSSTAQQPLTIQLLDQGNRRPLTKIQPQAAMTSSFTSSVQQQQQQQPQDNVNILEEFGIPLPSDLDLLEYGSSF